MYRPNYEKALLIKFFFYETCIFNWKCGGGHCMIIQITIPRNPGIPQYQTFTSCNELIKDSAIWTGKCLLTTDLELIPWW